MLPMSYEMAESVWPVRNLLTNRTRADEVIE